VCLASLHLPLDSDSPHHGDDPAPGTSSRHLGQGLRDGRQVGEHRVELAPGASGKGGTGSFRELVKGEPPDHAVIAQQADGRSRSESLARSTASAACTAGLEGAGSTECGSAMTPVCCILP